MPARLWLAVLICSVLAAQVCSCCGEDGDNPSRRVRASGRRRFKHGTTDRRRGGSRRGRLHIPIHRYRQIQEQDFGSLLDTVRGTSHPEFVSFIAGSNSSRPASTGLLGAARPTAVAAGQSALKKDLQEVASERRSVIKDAGCKPRKVPVQVPKPSDPLVLYTPSCVLVPRCSGCCGHELLECVPTEVKNIRKKVLALRFSEGDDLSLADQESSVKKIKMEKHVKCECQCKVKESSCSARQAYDAANCRCLCPNEHEAADCPGTKIWSETDCACKCAKEDECSTGLEFDPVQCRCLPSRPSGRPLLFSAAAPAQGLISSGSPGSSATTGGTSSAGWGSATSSGVLADRPPPRRTRPAQPSQTQTPSSQYQTATPYDNRRYPQGSASTQYDDRRYQQGSTSTSYNDRRYQQGSASTSYSGRRYQQGSTSTSYDDRQYQQGSASTSYSDRQYGQRGMPISHDDRRYG